MIIFATFLVTNGVNSKVLFVPRRLFIWARPLRTGLLVYRSFSSRVLYSGKIYPPEETAAPSTEEPFVFGMEQGPSVRLPDEQHTREKYRCSIRGTVLVVVIIDVRFVHRARTARSRCRGSAYTAVEKIFTCRCRAASREETLREGTSRHA